MKVTNELRREVGFFAMIVVGWIAFLMISAPPAKYYNAWFTEEDIFLGQEIEFNLEGIWYKQCPIEIYKNWTNEEGKLVTRVKPYKAGSVPPSYTKRIASFYHTTPSDILGPNDHPSEICLQLTVKHDCGRWSEWPTNNRTPKACAKVLY